MSYEWSVLYDITPEEAIIIAKEFEMGLWNTRIVPDELEYPVAVASGDTEDIWGYNGNN